MMGALDLLLEGQAFNAVTIALAMTAILVAVAAAVYQRRALSPPSRQLNIYSDPPASLLPDVSTEVTGLKVVWNEEKVEDPFVVNLFLTSTGRYDITNSQFNDEAPIHVDVSAKIVKVLGMSSSPERATPIPHTTDGSELTVGPCLIGRGQEIVAQLLTSGRPRLDEEELRQAVKHDLADVDVQYKKPATLSVTPRLLVIVAIIGILAAVFSLIASLQNDSRLAVAVTPDHGSVGSKIMIRGAGFDRYDVVTASFSTYYGAPSKEVGTVQADRRGAFQMEVTVPSGLPKGRVQLSLTPRNSAWVYKDFYVTG